MARNRRTHSAGIRFVPAIKALILCMLLGASSVGYVLQKNKIFELGHQIREREEKLEGLKWHNMLRHSQLAEMLNPEVLKQRLREFNLDLELPQPEQRIWLAEPTLTNETRNPSLLVFGKPGPGGRQRMMNP